MERGGHPLGVLDSGTKKIRQRQSNLGVFLNVFAIFWGGVFLYHYYYVSFVAVFIHVLFVVQRLFYLTSLFRPLIISGPPRGPHRGRAVYQKKQACS